MLGVVRMGLLPPAYLAGTVGVDPLVIESSEALRILAEAKRYSELRGAERAVSQSDGRLRKRKHVSVGQRLVVVGGKSGGSSLKSAKVYDTSAGQWRALPEMSVARVGCAAVCIDGNVRVVGGYDGGSCLKSAEMYDASARQWRALPEMSVARQGCAAVCIDGNVYVVGGASDVATPLAAASMECYDPIASEWRTLPSMSSTMLFCAAVACDIMPLTCELAEAELWAVERVRTSCDQGACDLLAAAL